MCSGTATRSRCYRRWPVGDVTYLVHERIDPASLIDRVKPEHGGTAAFVGTVRRGPEDGPVVAIEYSAYEEMAEAEFSRIVSRAAERWPGARVEIRHRLGRVPTGEASVAVAVSAPHRAEAFDACRLVIEELKKNVPIWKREILDDGTNRWRHNGEPSGEGKSLEENV